jgi:hypothetical protein
MVLNYKLKGFDMGQVRFFLLWVLTTAVMLCFSQSAIAWLGETEKQLTARYGKSPNVDDPDNAWDDKTLFFEIPGPAGGRIEIIAYLVEGVCVAENYSFFTKDGAESPITGGSTYDAAKAIVQANSQGHTWRGQPGLPPRGMELLWRRSDGELNTAVVWKSALHRLDVTTAEARTRVEQHAKGVGGF